MEDELDRLTKLEKQIKAGGGEKRIQQHASGKLTARERIDLRWQNTLNYIAC